MKRLLLATCALFAVPEAAKAQATDISPDTAAGISLGTSVSRSGSTYTIDGGTLSGTNLFHSFSTFDLGQGDVAQWVYSSGDPASISNVVNRVTGGTPSSIFGTLDSTAIPNADFYFINPAGIVFGAGAQVDVPAAAYFSTASNLNFSDGRTLSVATPSGSTLSVASPESFGFLGNEGDISFAGVENTEDSTFLTNAGPLGLSAANVRMDDTLIGSSALDAVAVGDSPLTVAVAGAATDGPARGEIRLTNSWLQTWPGDCFDSCLGTEGHISLHAGDLVIDSTGVVADFDSEDGGDGASFILLQGDNGVAIRSSSILADGYGAAEAGSIAIRSPGDLSIADSIILTYTEGDGDAGFVELSGRNIDVNNSFITSDSYGFGNAGAVGIFADESLVLRGGSQVGSSANDFGDAGIVFLQAPDMLIDENSQVSTSSFTDASAGDVVIEAGELTITGTSNIASSAVGDGTGGNILITADDMELSGASTIASDAYGDGDAGFVAVTVNGEALISDGSSVSSDSGIAGDPDALGSSGDILFTAGSLLLDQGFILSRAFASGDSGFIDVEVADDLTIDSGTISSDAMFGDAGSIFVSAASADLSFGAISSDAHGGNGGDVTILVGGDMALQSFSVTTNAGDDFLSSDTGSGGNVYIGAESLSMDSSNIASRAIGQGDGGTVTIDLAGPLSMFASNIFTDTLGEGDAGDVSITGTDASLDFSSISSDSLGDGFGGIVSLDLSGDLSGDDGSYISSDALGAGDGGGVVVSAGSLHFDNNAYISSDALGDGNGGGVLLTIAGEMVLRGGGYVSSDSVSTGDAGAVGVTAGSMILDDGSISSDAYGDGNGGLTSVEVDGTLEESGGSYISADALGNGDGGGVEITAGTLDLSGPANITSDAWGDGDAGYLLLDAGSMNLSDGALISSSSYGAGDAFGVFITAGGVTLSDSSIVSDAHASGDAGGVFLEVTDLDMQGSTIRSEAASTGFGGSVSIEATGSVTLSNSTLATNANGTGDAGDIGVEAADIILADGSAISSDARSPDGGESGLIFIEGDSLTMTGGSVISTGSANANSAGFVDVFVSDLLMEGHGTEIRSENTSSSAGSAGSISIEAHDATIADGAGVSTNSLNGPAGDIVFFLPDDGLLKLLGTGEPGTIETSSGPGTGGIISIGSPLAIISNGGVIKALGDVAGANVDIDTPYFIASSDRSNIVAVNGSLTFSNAIYDVSTGTADVDLTMLDASSVLQGQCSSVRATGRVSQLNIRPSGPFGDADWPTLESPEPAAPGPLSPGGCQ